MARRKKVVPEGGDVVGGAAERVEAVPRVVSPARCGRCESTDLRVVYTTPYLEAGVRRVTAECRCCGVVNYWDEVLR
jgi:hypothetical protein